MTEQPIPSEFPYIQYMREISFSFSSVHLKLDDLLNAPPLEVDEGLDEGVGDDPLPLLGAANNVLQEVVEHQVLRRHLTTTPTALP